MSRASSKIKAIEAINKRGILLVYPLNNKPEPSSIWSELHPRTKMRWEWDSSGDNRVAELWSLREELSRSREVIYSKWFQGRATFFSKAVFVDLLAFLQAPALVERHELGPESANVLELLVADSPLSTKQLKVAAELEGKSNEPTFNRVMRPLWRRLLLVGFGEFEDSSFPSLGIAATQSMFEDEWLKAHKVNEIEAGERLVERLGKTNSFWKWATRIRNENLDKPQRTSYT